MTRSYLGQSSSLTFRGWLINKMTQILHQRHTSRTWLGPGHCNSCLPPPGKPGLTTKNIICQGVGHIYYTLVVASVYELDLVLMRRKGDSPISTHLELHLLHFSDNAIIPFPLRSVVCHYWLNILNLQLVIVGQPVVCSRKGGWEYWWRWLEWLCPLLICNKWLELF